jgi:lysophospholipase L1-like esterase
MHATRLVAIGDSFTEGYGDDQPDGTVRGWADLAAVGIATAQGEPIEYANLAVRGRLLAPILDEQLDAAIALRPSHLSINGGGNDLLRPRVTIEWVSGRLEQAVHRILDAGITPVMVSGANPSGVMAGGGLMGRRGDALRDAVRAWSVDLDVPFVDNWTDAELQHGRFWTDDRLHLNATGHARAATTFLRALGLEAPAAWRDLVPRTTAEGRRDAVYYRTHVMPWIGRRLTGRSSGDGRAPKLAAPVVVEPLRA